MNDIELEKIDQVIFHSLSKEDVLVQLRSDENKGLSETEVARRLQIFGSNNIAERQKKNLFFIFFTQFKSPIVILLLVAAGLSFGFSEWMDGFAIGMVIIVNAIIGFYMEYQAEQSMQSLKKMFSAPANVIRNGHLSEINSENIIPGDIVSLQAGDIVPGDGRLISLSELQADESALTGESLPVEKKLEAISPESSVGDRTNMLFKGTFISKGNAYMVVTGTGMKTELGKVASLVQSAKQTTTPLEIKLQSFSKKLIQVTVALIVIIFVAGLLNGQNFIQMLETSIALGVAAIPEGLPIVATLALARGMMKLARHKVIVKKLSAVETLGGTNVICTDKTGTLTKNKIEVKEIYPVSESARTVIKDISILCNTAEIYTENGEMKEIGDPLETGLLKFFLGDALEDIPVIRNKYPKIKEEPFSSETKIMATLHPTENGHRVYVKGAVEELLKICTHILGEKGEEVLNSEKRNFWLEKSDNLASSGLRIIASGYREAKKDELVLSKDIVFCGLIGMFDPPREDVFAAIEDCKTAGIHIVMITGDHPATALNIAQELKITEPDDTNVIVGKDMKDFAHLNEQEKNEWLSCRVFARVSPKHKLDIVKVWQERKFVVGMTGDGINDSPALKKADIGIAMGERGTQVAQEVADMVIKDDSFSSIIMAIRQGRIIFENIRHFVIFLLSCNLSELFIISIASVFSLHFQLFPIQILFINIVTDVLPALALGITGGNDEIMKMKPRNESEPIIDKQRWWTIIFYSLVISLTNISAVSISHLTVHKTELWNPELCNNILFFSLIFTQLLHVLNMGKSGTSFFKSEVFRSKYVWYSIVLSLMVIFGLYAIGPVREVLSVHSLSLGDWAICLSTSICSFIIIQTAKALKIVKQ